MTPTPASVRHGTPSTVVSSRTPPESVSTSRAPSSRADEVQAPRRVEQRDAGRRLATEPRPGARVHGEDQRAPAPPPRRAPHAEPMKPNARSPAPVRAPRPPRRLDAGGQTAGAGRLLGGLTGRGPRPPRSSRPPEHDVEEVAHRVRLAGADHQVVRLLLPGMRCMASTWSRACPQSRRAGARPDLAALSLSVQPLDRDLDAALDPHTQVAAPKRCRSQQRRRVDHECSEGGTSSREGNVVDLGGFDLRVGRALDHPEQLSGEGVAVRSAM